MSKERLERLKKISNNVSLNGALSTHLKLSDLLFLIEQAERVSELETRIDKFYKLNMQWHRQNELYREALKFYANEDAYEPFKDWHGNMSADVMDDGGEEACKALEDTQ